MENLDKNNTIAEFEHQISRYEIVGEIHKAFVFCLSKLSDRDMSDRVESMIRMLVNKYNYKIFEQSGSKYKVHIDFLLDSNWLLDIAISSGYKSVESTKISTGLFSSVSGIAIGSLLKKQCFGLSINTKNNTTTIYCTTRALCDDYKMIHAISEELIKLYSYKSIDR